MEAPLDGARIATGKAPSYLLWTMCHAVGNGISNLGQV